MAMQTDVRSYHQHQTGFAYVGRTRLKAYSVRGSSNDGRLDLFDSITAPISATYAQSGTTVTVTSNAHGLLTGDEVGLSFNLGTSGGGTAAPNSTNYRITVTGDNTFTLTTINSTTISAGSVCRYAAETANGGGFIMTIIITAGDTFNNYYLLPGEGILVHNAIHATMTNVSSLSCWIG